MANSSDRLLSRIPFVVVVLALSINISPQAASDQVNGRAVYQAACASCHGADGAGVAQAIVGFDTPLPDFNDCSFASREPDADWVAVTHSGGPVRGFSRRMPAFEGALSLDEIQAALTYIRSLCGDDDWPAGELNLPRPLVTEKAYPEDEAVLTTTVSAEGPGVVLNELVYEKRFGARNQIELSLPFGWQDSGLGITGSDWNWGIGDLGVGVKRAIYHSLNSGSIFSVGGEVILPTGEEEKGFGSGTPIFEPFAAFGQILPRDFFLHAQGGLELPVDGEQAEEEAFWRVVLGKSFTEGQFGRTWSPMLEVVASREFETGAEVDWDVLPQFQVTLNRRQHVMMNLGVRLPVNDRGARDTQIIVYLLWDWFDGGFFEGW